MSFFDDKDVVRRRKRARRRKNGAEVVAGCFVVGALATIVFLVSVLLIYFGWNIGVVGIAAALGSQVGKISFEVAVGVSLIITVIRSIFSAAVTKLGG